MSRRLSDKAIAELPRIISGDEGIKKSLPLLDKLGTELARLYKFQEESQESLDRRRAEMSGQNPLSVSQRTTMPPTKSQQKRMLERPLEATNKKIRK